MRQPDLVEHRPDLLLLLTRGAKPLDDQWLAQGGLNPHPRVKRSERILEHHLQVAAGEPQRPSAVAKHLLAGEHDPAAVGLLDPDGELAERRLAAP